MKTILHISFLVCFNILLFSVGYSQNGEAEFLPIDSLNKALLQSKDDTNKVNTLNNLSFAYVGKTDFEQIIKYAEEAEALSEKLSFKKGLINAYLNIGIGKNVQKDQNSALNFYKRALALSIETGNKQDILRIYSFIEDMYIGFEKYAEALNTSLDAQKIREQTGDKNEIGYGLIEMGNNYSRLKNDSESLKSNYSALKYFQETNNKNLITVCYFDIGQIYCNAGNYSEALKKYSDAFQILKELKDTAAYGMAFYYAAIADVYAKQGQLEYDHQHKVNAFALYEKALKKYLISYRIYKSMTSMPSIASVVMDIGKLYIKLGDPASAKKYLDSSRIIWQSVGLKEGLMQVYGSLSSLDSLQGNYKEAYLNYQTSILYRDSINMEENSKKAVQIQMQRDFDIKQSIAKTEQEKRDAIEERVKSRQYYIMIGLGIVIIAIFIISLIQFKNNSLKQKANGILEATLNNLKSTQSQLIQAEKMASLGELTAGIAHEIQNPLNFVNNFSEVNKELLVELKDEIKKGNVGEVNAIADDVISNEEKINHHGKRADAIVKGMLQHSRSSTGVKELTDINALADEYLRLSYQGLKAKDKDFNATIKTDFDNTIEKINIIPQDIGRVLLNLYNNAFYAVNEKSKQRPNDYDPTISVTTKKVANKVELTVKDNGNGISQNIVDKIFQPFFTTKPTGQGTGLGLSLSYDIIKAHGGEIKVETEEGGTTQFIIQLPFV